LGDKGQKVKILKGQEGLPFGRIKTITSTNCRTGKSIQWGATTVVTNVNGIRNKRTMDAGQTQGAINQTWTKEGQNTGKANQNVT